MVWWLVNFWSAGRFWVYTAEILPEYPITPKKTMILKWIGYFDIESSDYTQDLRILWVWEAIFSIYTQLAISNSNLVFTE